MHTRQNADRKPTTEHPVQKLCMARGVSALWILLLNRDCLTEAETFKAFYRSVTLSNIIPYY